jgi:hypothetical protein
MPEGRKRKGRESIGKGIFYFLARGSFAMTMTIPGKAKIAFPRVRVGNAPTKDRVHVKRPIGSVRQEQCQKRVGAEGHAKTALS